MIKLASLLVTRKCNYSCSHCIGDYGPHSEGELTLYQVKYYIDQLPEQQTEFLNITGGEPTLYEHLMETIEYADRVRKRSGFPEKITMVTNCSWAKEKDPSEYLKELKQAGLDTVDFSIDNFRTEEQNRLAREVIDAVSNKNILETFVHETKLVTPIGRGYNIPKELWIERRDGVKLVNDCPIDGWAFDLIGEKSRPTALVSPKGLYLCGCVSEVAKIGELGEPFSVIEPRIKKIGRFVRALAAFDPSVVAKEMNKQYGLNISTEHDCISCRTLFDDIGYGYIQKIVGDGSFEKIVDSLMSKLPKK